MNPLKQPRILIGGVLVVLGIVLVGMNVGIIDYVPLSRFWPFILILIGLTKFFQGDQVRVRWSAAWLLLLGIWFQLVTFKAFGLTYRNSWPLMLIGWGLYLTGEAMSRRSGAQLAKENVNGN